MQGNSADASLVVFWGVFYLFRIHLSFPSYMPEATRAASKGTHA